MVSQPHTNETNDNSPQKHVLVMVIALGVQILAGYYIRVTGNGKTRTYRENYHAFTYLYIVAFMVVDKAV